MRSFFVVTFLITWCLVPAQESAGDSEKAEMIELKEPLTYTSNNEMFLFTPETKSIKIEKLFNEEKIDFGKLRKATEDGLYVMTSKLTEEVYFGRFDSLYNFKILRYEPQTDSLIESLFIRSNKKTLPDLKK